MDPIDFAMVAIVIIAAAVAVYSVAVIRKPREPEGSAIGRSDNVGVRD